MRGNSFRFHPPSVELTPALRWTLARAYGPDDSVASLAPSERPRALYWSRALKVVERIASRQLRARVETEVGVEVAEAIWRARDALAARSLLLQQLLDKAVGQAAELDCPVVALKGIALLESGAASWGGRPLVDLDLLVARDQAAALATSLRGLGLQPSGTGERHHLPPLSDPRLGELELHLSLPGVSVGDSPITPEHLRRVDLVEPSARLSHLLLPAPPLLVAHLVAHGLDQHGLSPTAYPVTRLASDLLDLGGRLDLPVAELGAAAAPLLARSVSKREIGAVTTLSELLAAGAIPDSESGDARALLFHTLAATRVPGYRRSLRRRAAMRAIGRRDWRKLRPRFAEEN